MDDQEGIPGPPPLPAELPEDFWGAGGPPKELFCGGGTAPPEWGAVEKKRGLKYIPEIDGFRPQYPQSRQFNIGVNVFCTGPESWADRYMFSDECIYETIAGISRRLNGGCGTVNTPPSQKATVDVQGTINLNLYVRQIFRRFVIPETNGVADYWHSNSIAETGPFAGTLWDTFCWGEQNYYTGNYDAGGISPRNWISGLQLYVAPSTFGGHVGYTDDNTFWNGRANFPLTDVEVDIGNPDRYYNLQSKTWAWVQPYCMGSLEKPLSRDVLLNECEVTDAMIDNPERTVGDGSIIAHEFGHHLGIRHAWDGGTAVLDECYPAYEAQGCHNPPEAPSMPLQAGAMRVEGEGRSCNWGTDELYQARTQTFGSQVASPLCGDPLFYNNYMNYNKIVDAFSYEQTTAMRSVYSLDRLTVRYRQPEYVQPLNMNDTQHLPDSMRFGDNSSATKAYVGGNLVWTSPNGAGGDVPPDANGIQVSVKDTYWVRGDGTNCSDMADWTSCFNGTHNITDPGREISYEESPGGGLSDHWIGPGFQPDTFTQPNTLFVMTGRTGTCVDGDEYPSVSAPLVRVQFKLSDGTITDWAYSPS